MTAQVRNTFRVPVRQWRKWDDDQRRVFNGTYDWVHDNQSVTTHPKAPKHSAAQWKTVAWNVAWIAADALRDELPDEVVTVARKR